MTAKGIALIILLIIQLLGRIGSDFFNVVRSRTDDDERWRLADLRQLICIVVSNVAAMLFIAVALFAIKDECM